MKLQGVIFDWAGTLADHGSRAPVAALMSVFSAAGVAITTAEARHSMGLAKRKHIEAILALPRVRDAWAERNGAPPAPSTVDELYSNFIPQQLACLESHSRLIEGVPELAGRLRARGLKIGSTTGYTRPMLDSLLDRARKQGFAPDFAACPDDVPSGRPAPYMCFLNATRLETYPLWSLVKIGDTAVDVEEGLNAGMWTIGVTRTGNEVGLTEIEWDATPAHEKVALISAAEQRLIDAGAHFITESVADCDGILDSIQARLTSGERP